MAHIEEYVGVIKGWICANTFEFPRAYLDDGYAEIILEIGCRFVRHSGPSQGSVESHLDPNLPTWPRTVTNCFKH